MKILVLSLFLSIPILSFCQPKFSYGGNVNLGVSKISVNNAQLPMGIEDHSEADLNFSLGVETQVDLTHNVFFRSGLNYTHRNYRHILQGTSFEFFGPFLMKSSIKDEVSIGSFGIPVEMGISLKETSGGTKYYFGFGGSISLSMNTNAETVVFTDEIEPREFRNDYYEYNQSNFTPVVFLGLTFNLSDGLLLGVEPTVRFPSTTFRLYFSDVDVESGPEFGLTFRLRAS